MFSLLIVDDDYIAIEGIRDLIDWSSLGICIVAEAEDGAEALAKAREVKPDIVLTDVVMPVMDGIKLAEALRNEMPLIKLVMISGHQDVHYLKSAMKLEAVDYILKPFKLEELKEVMQKTVQKLERERMEQFIHAEVKQEFASGIPVVALPEVQAVKDDVLSLIGSGNPEGLETAIRKLFTTLRQRGMNSILFLTAICTELMARASRRVASQTAIEGIEELVSGVQHFGGGQSSYQLEQSTVRYLLKMESILQDSRTGKTLRIIREVEELIRQRYSQNVTIQSIANEVYVSAGHLQALFKKETGITLNDYLTSVRIDAAKQLLVKDPGMKVYEVAHAVGYQDTNYFSRIFKKLVGVNPQEYR